MAIALTGMPDREAQHARIPGLRGWLLLAPLAAWLVLFVVIPTLLLIAISFCERDAVGRIVFDFTWENYLRGFDTVYLRIFGLSLLYAFVTAVICLIIGYPVAYCIGRAGPGVRNLLLLLLMVPFWTSFLIRTYAWISILSNQGLLNGWLQVSGLLAAPVDWMYTPMAVILGLVYNFLPFMILPIYGNVEKLDLSVIEAAYDLGARPFRALWQVIIPLTWPGIVAGFFLVFVPAIAMFAITTLMGGGSVPAIGEVIQRQFFAGRNQPFGAALGTLLLLVFFAALWFSRSRKTELV